MSASNINPSLSGDDITATTMASSKKIKVPSAGVKTSDTAGSRQLNSGSNAVLNEDVPVWLRTTGTTTRV